MLKSDLLNTIAEYKKLESSVPDIIDRTGYKSHYIAKCLKLPVSTFYFKRKQNKFSTDEIYQIINLIHEHHEN